MEACVPNVRNGEALLRHANGCSWPGGAAGGRYRRAVGHRLVADPEAAVLSRAALWVLELATRHNNQVYGIQPLLMLRGGGLRHTLASHGCCSRGSPVGR